MAVDSAPQLITVGVIARELDEPIHRVLNVLATRSHIKPSAFAGTFRLYEKKCIAQVRHELHAIDARRCHQQPVPLPT